MTNDEQAAVKASTFIRSAFELLERAVPELPGGDLRDNALATLEMVRQLDDKAKQIIARMNPDG